jgi:radical SAM protein with 4Fe4S-binding SPASM domain
MSLRLSRYTVVFLQNGKMCLYNTRTGGAAMAPLLEGGIEPTTLALLKNPQSIIRLAGNGLVVDEKTDEVMALEKEYQQSKNNQRLACLIVIPSYACNCACPDCYQLGYDTKSHFNHATYDRIGDFTSYILTRNRPEVFALYLYGGEPFLQSARCCQLLDSLREACEEKHVRFHTVVATNGTVLKNSTARDLAEKIDEVYVSMCQGKEEQAWKRPLRTRRNSYAQVLEGISLFARLNKSVRIRVNVSSIERLAEDLRTTCEEIRQAAEPHHEQLSFEFSLLHFARPDCSSRASSGPDGDVERMYAEVRRVGSPQSWPRNRFVLPKPGFRAVGHSALRDGPCPYLNGTRFVITPDGQFRVCNALKDKPEYAFCNVTEYSQLFDLPRYKQLTRSVALEDPECLACEYLPICLTKCGVGIENGGGLHSGGCKAEQRRKVEAYARSIAG